MKIKNFFNALIMAFLAVTLLVSCETKGPVGIDKDNIYLLGN